MAITPSSPAVDAVRSLSPFDGRPTPNPRPTGPDRTNEAPQDAAGPSGADDPARKAPGDDDSGWVGVNEALYRLRSNWSPASHEGESAVVSLPRPDVIAAYHRGEQSDGAVLDALAALAAVPAEGQAPRAVAIEHQDILV